jgi:hypothetical protein
MLTTHKDILERLVRVENKLTEHDHKIILIFEYIKQLKEVKQNESDFKERNRIGYKSSEE